MNSLKSHLRRRQIELQFVRAGSASVPDYSLLGEYHRILRPGDSGYEHSRLKHEQRLAHECDVLEKALGAAPPSNTDGAGEWGARPEAQRRLAERSAG